MSTKITATVTKTKTHPLQRTAKATNGDGVPTAFATLENILVISSPQINPAMTHGEEKPSGDAITGAVYTTARLEGVSRIWLVAPDDYEGPDVRTIRIIEETVPQPATKSPIRGFGAVPSPTYLN